jgi:calnexin
VGTDNSVKILVDNVEVKAASLTDDTHFKPPVNPPKEIDDPEDSKPEDWVDEPKMDEPGTAKPEDWDEDAPLQIEDPAATKPDDWLDDAPDMVADPSAVKPDDWDADEDGDWEPPLIANPDCNVHGCGEWKAPMITNPSYKGKWYAPKVDNPDYRGIWSPRQIVNPTYFVDDKPYAMAPIGGIGIELWTMQDGILFDNILVTADPAVAAVVAAKTFVPRKAAEDAAATAESRKPPTGGGFVDTVKYYAMEGVYYAQENAVLVGITFCLGLIPLIALCCTRSKEKEDMLAPPPAPPAQDGEVKEGDEDEEDEDELPIQEVEQKAEEKKPVGGAKKRTPKAS